MSRNYLNNKFYARIVHNFVEEFVSDVDRSILLIVENDAVFARSNNSIYQIEGAESEFLHSVTFGVEKRTVLYRRSSYTWY